MELKYVAWGLLLTFVVLALFASNVGEKAKNAWSHMWCLGSDHTEIDDFSGMTRKDECIDSVGNSTEVGSSICIILLAAGLITYVVRQQQQ